MCWRTYENIPLSYDPYIFHGKSAGEFVRRRTKSVALHRRVVFVSLDSDSYNATDYNRLLKDETFGAKIDAERQLLPWRTAGLGVGSAGRPLSRITHVCQPNVIANGGSSSGSTQSKSSQQTTARAQIPDRQVMGTDGSPSYPRRPDRKFKVAGLQFKLGTWVLVVVLVALAAALLLYVSQDASPEQQALQSGTARGADRTLHQELVGLSATMQALQQQLEEGLRGLEGELALLRKQQGKLERRNIALQKRAAPAPDAEEGKLELDDCDGFENNFTNSFDSIITRGLTWRFYCLALKSGTDKVTGTERPVDHHYQYMYSKYLRDLRDEPVRLMEIGLGCDMSYGPGQSLAMWRATFPNGSISFVEFNRKCAEKFKKDIEEAARGTLYLGSQDDSALMQGIVADAAKTGLYDIIIDDGSHDPTSQLQSLHGLWPALKSGGIYLVEDVHTNFFPMDPSRPMFMDWISKLVKLVHCHSGMKHDFFSADSIDTCEKMTELEKQVLSVECQIEACVLVKR